MNNIEHKFYIQELYVKQYEGCPNAVARVKWVCVLKRGKGKLHAMGITDLAEPSTDAFINIASLEAQQVLDWVIAQEGGQPWVESLVTLHEDAMQNAEFNADFEPWHIPLVNPIRFDPLNV